MGRGFEACQGDALGVGNMALSKALSTCPGLCSGGRARMLGVYATFGYSLMSYIPGCKIVFEGVIFLVFFYAQEKVENTIVVVCLT